MDQFFCVLQKLFEGKNGIMVNIINEIKKLYQNDFDTSSYYSNTKFNIFIQRSRDDID